METYGIGLVPGPVSVPPELRAPYQKDYGSPDLEEDFFTLYQACETNLETILATKNRVVIQSGEGMVALWGALKSVLRPGDRVLAVANGVFGYGIADMARQLGMTVEVDDFGYDDVPDPDKVRDAAKRLRPRLMTAVHCETPSGTLTELAPLGAVSAQVGALFYVDFVSSGCGGEIRVDDWHIDLGLLGSQKVLSLLPDLAMVTVSDPAWEAVKGVGYAGYDALAPWRTGVADRYLPYTHNWRAMAALELATRRLLEGRDSQLCSSVTPRWPPRAGGACEPWAWSSSPRARRSALPRSRPRGSRPAGPGQILTGPSGRAVWSWAGATAPWPGRSSALATWAARRIKAWSNGEWMFWKRS